MKHNRYTGKILATWAIGMLGLWAQGQDMATQIAESLKQYALSEVHEKLYVHTDKDYYLTGEVLWLKVYAVEASQHKPLAFSKVCYIELLDSANIPMVQSKIAMDGATGTGSLYLQQSLQAGNYKLRAYTRWMQNFGADLFFEKTLTIVNLNKLPELAPTHAEPELYIDFFAEGGHLVNGLENKVAFMVSAKHGGSTAFTGMVLDNGTTLLPLKATHNGMGSFTLKPEQGHSYTAEITPVGGKPMTVTLPTAKNSGAVLQITQNGDSYTVTASTNVAGEQALYLLAHTRNITKFATKISLTNGKGSHTFNQSALGEGISAITLFNQQGEPLCERLVFKQPDQDMELSLNATKTVFEMRDSVVISISAAQLGLDDSASLSLSVFKTDSLQGVSPVDIQAYLLLQSGLKGRIDNPGYYLRNKSPETAAALDLLLLTQGWRSFNWQEVLAKRQQQVQLAPELQGHIVTGTVVENGSNRPAKGVTAYLSAPSPITVFKTAVSDSNGLIKADLLNFFGSNKLVAQTQEDRYRVKINSPFSNAYTANTLPALYRPTAYPNTLLEQSISMQVQNIYTGEAFNQFGLPAVADTLSFYQRPDERYLLDDYTRFTTMEEVLREYVTLVDVRIRNQEVILHMIDPVKKVFFEGEPLNLLDGVPLFNFTKFFEFDPKKIERLDLIAQQYVLGNSTFNGVLNWKTYQPSMSHYEFAQHIAVVDYESLQLARVFYSPQYDDATSKGSKLPDYRNVLHWNPDISVKQQQAATTSFYTSDLPGRYVMVVQGISATGKMGSSVGYFEVK